MEHNDDITAFAISPDLKYAATGNIGPKPLIAVWDVTTMECVARINGPLEKGIKTLSFSNNGKLLAASAMDDDHCVAVYEWSKPTKDNKPITAVASGKGTRAKILSIGFTADDSAVVATAIKEVVFFSYQNGAIKGKKGSFGKGNQLCAVPCQATVDSVLYAGSFSGEIFAFGGQSIKETIKAHTGVVNAMASRPKVKGILSGGKDGKIILWIQ